ncbi:pilus assembly protein TadF [Grimontia hollisae]|uniref:Flp pilus assembly surface protein TadF n=2 Tax=Grimontia hollisae TaxID=673 RepID=D0I9A6_GRIHO|nr:tight adherence pilus pseudopilin TadF [Grimontia hollisae]AMG29411.2 pilus assembly protein TadF [Grimontia hollisae]EEY72021.1 Flp pilus assembly surface protein TadF [Grimontia hollisae CIP 101886]STO77539.1 Uncharacterised protein [Grimontia hollisae]STO98527.1 Uncharacterised protein [Grimontia hollisae]
MTSSANKQHGVFAIELAMVLLGLSLIIVFTMDVVVKQSAKGKLDRLSYSTVSLLKERNQLFDGEETMTYSEMSQAFQLVAKSMRNTMGTFDISRLGMYVEQQRFDADKRPVPAIQNVHIYRLGSYPCAPDDRLENMIHLAPVTQFDNRLTLYRVTLCYRTDNWFGELVGGQFERARSIATSFGR